MTTLQAVTASSKIESEELYEITKILLESLNIDADDKNSSSYAEREQVLDSFSNLIEQYLKMNFSGSKEKKLRLMKFVAKLNMQKELLHISSGNITLQDLELAGKRLGKKSQSAFEQK